MLDDFIIKYFLHANSFRCPVYSHHSPHPLPPLVFWLLVMLVIVVVVVVVVVGHTLLFIVSGTCQINILYSADTFLPFALSENIALQRNAVHSSECCSGVPSRAVDGNFDGLWSHASCTHTQLQTDPWWRVDLGSSKPVSEVFIVNRVGFEKRLNNAELRVGK